MAADSAADFTPDSAAGSVVESAASSLARAVASPSAPLAEADEVLDDAPGVAAGTLYVVATPIGNLGDMTYRAVETLRQASLILCEDTRHSRPLLDHFGVSTPVASLHEHNEAREVPRLLARLRQGASIALISDAGTPLVSDPGERLVLAAVEAGVPVVPVPGASAVVAALSASGLPTDGFTFLGFLARKGKERAAQLERLSALPHTGVVYESPARVADTLDDLVRVLGSEASRRRAVIARELTKKFEEFRRGTVAELATSARQRPPRGEVVILLEGRGAQALDEVAIGEMAQALRAGGATTKEIVRTLTEGHGVPRNLAYRLAQGAHHAEDA
ncbi:MAG TPA: 16S rRNA (cytidine(1402)-2'-O)-methyltransferase [Gemmatimonadaceae bacterium]|nr:16S rRNA (cytidine(1402)-2'-O)-methyltransferase [Gemmatimonadaceae bacterium]